MDFRAGEGAGGEVLQREPHGGVQASPGPGAGTEPRAAPRRRAQPLDHGGASRGVLGEKKRGGGCGADAEPRWEGTSGAGRVYRAAAESGPCLEPCRAGGCSAASPWRCCCGRRPVSAGCPVWVRDVPDCARVAPDN